jgi:Domain of unknown function (DUF3854)
VRANNVVAFPKLVEVRDRPKGATPKAKRQSPSKSKRQCSPATLEDLKKSGLDATDAESMGIEDVDSEWCQQHIRSDVPGYKIPYYDFDGVLLAEDYRVRRLFRPPHNPKVEANNGPKYLQAPGSVVRAYLSRRIDWTDVLTNPAIPVVTTEGEKKSEAACKANIVTVGLGGVDSFASGKRDIDLLPELVTLAKDRRCAIVYDSDINDKDKHDMRRARKKLALQYHLAGGFPEFIDLPQGPAADDGKQKKVGLDDYLLAHSKKDFLSLPRREITPQLLVRWLHNKKKNEKLGFDPEATARLIGRVVTEAMRRHGRFIKTDATNPELLYFDAASAKIFGLDEGRGRQLRSFVERAYDVNGADPQWKQVHEQSANYCQAHGQLVTVHKLSFYDRKTHTLYIARSEGELFQITARGRKVVPNGTNGVFIRTEGRLKDIEPATVNNRRAFERISRTANFQNDDVMSNKSAVLLWESWQLATFFPQLMPTRPIVLFTGEPGSRKTSAARAFGRSLMGDKFDVSIIDKDKLDGLDAAIVDNPFVVIDNADGTIPGLENRLATAATGGKLPRRKLYVTMQNVNLPYDAFLAVTAFNPRSLTRTDVVDRELLLPCGRSNGFKPENVVLAEIDDNRAEWWAYVLDRLSKIVAAFANPRSAELEEMRLADFARFVQLAAPALGYNAKEVKVALTAMVAAKCEFVASMTSIPDALATVVEGRVAELYWECLGNTDKEEFKAKLAENIRPWTAGDLLAETRRRVNTFHFENPKAFGTALKAQLGAVQTRIDCGIAKDGHTKQNVYTIGPTGGWCQAVQALAVKIKAEKGPK